MSAPPAAKPRPFSAFRYDCSRTLPFYCFGNAGAAPAPHSSFIMFIIPLWLSASRSYRVPTVGRISRFSTVAFAGSRTACTTAWATVCGVIIFWRGA